MRPASVLVAVPARDEEDLIVDCLASIRTAARGALAGGFVRHVQVVVSAHRCTDSTFEVAAAFLAEEPSLGGFVRRDDDSPTIGDARRRAIRAACALGGYDPASTWMFSTDADSCVPPTWLSATLTQAAATAVVAVAGLVDVPDWEAPRSAHRAYAQIVDAGLRPGGHDHVYGANLAVRLDAYLDVGGFPSAAHGEDHGLVRNLRSAGWPVGSSVEPVVRTSGRMPGRAARGLGDLLGALARSARRPMP